MTDTLLDLLRRIRDGLADPGEIARARELVRVDPRLDDELRTIALTDADDLAGDAAGLLAVLGVDDLGDLIARAIVGEGGAAETAVDAVALEVQDWTHGPDIVAAVTSEAGDIKVTNPILATLSLREPWNSHSVADAVRHQAGSVDVVTEVLRKCGLDGHIAPIAAAIRDEAGTVDLARDVVRWTELDVAAAIRRSAGRVEIVSEVMARLAFPVTLPAERAPPERPANDNRAFALAGLVLAAAVALFVSLAGIDVRGDGDLSGLAFAHADEVVVEDLSSETDVLMLQGSGQDGALILWVDEET